MPPVATPAVAVIPARYGSTRFPGKPLADRTGKPLIRHVYERVQQARRLSRVVVATDDGRIARAVAAFGGEAILTGDHPNGTSRIAEAIDRLEGASGGAAGDASGGGGGVVVNVQGDEPEIEPAVIDALVDALAADAAAPMATVVSPFADDEDPANPNIVKAVVSQRGRALYFSRSLIPHLRQGGTPTPPFKHVGIYAYRRAFLKTYLKLAPSPLEQAEQLEQLRVLEHGYPIAAVICRTSHHGIDTPEQYDAFVRRMTGQA